MKQLRDLLYTETGWEIIEKQFDEKQIITAGSNFMLGNGYLGYRGTFAEFDKEQYVACIVSDTYDSAGMGQWRELCNVPNALYTKVEVDGEECSVFQGNISNYTRKLNLQNGVFTRNMEWQGSKNKKICINEEKFASYNNLHLICMHYQVQISEDAELKITTGIDGDVWDLYGPHLVEYDLKHKNGMLIIENKTNEFEIQINVVEGLRCTDLKPTKTKIIKHDKKIFRELEFQAKKGDVLTLDKFMIIYTSNDVDQPYKHALRDMSSVLNSSYHNEKQKQEKHWNEHWNKYDIKIEGNIRDQTITRFNLYHALIATPAHSEYLPIGARGLSCQTYQGAAFWDQEIFNEPMFLYTNPDIVKKLVKYRYHTLDGARRKARELGFYGAFYPWMSGKTGEELCPSYFFKNVLTGRKIHNHFNDWQIHISPDIAFAIWRYYRATGDWKFIADYGAEMIFEIAQFLVSRAYFKKDKNRYEFLRVLGPDEYHENVDNNPFTNYQAQFTVQRAVEIVNKMKSENPKKLDALFERLHLDEKNVEIWKEMADLIYLPQPDPDTLLIEQFQMMGGFLGGYFDLEDITPQELKKRLKDPSEYWGWPNGIAVETQVMKQADVIQLFVLYPHLFSKDVMKANFDYYEKRDQRGSSLSASAYATIAANLGYLDKAYDLFIESSTVDLFNTSKQISGGTFLGGIHTAAAAIVWQIIVQGFLGFDVLSSKQIVLNPKIPDQWEKISCKLVFRNNKFNISVTTDLLEIEGSKVNQNTISLQIQNKLIDLNPNEKKIIPLA